MTKRDADMVLALGIFGFFFLGLVIAQSLHNEHMTAFFALFTFLSAPLMLVGL